MADGLTAIGTGMEKAATGVITDVLASLEDVSGAIVQAMKARVAVDTGALKDSIRYESDTSKKDEISCYVYADAKSQVGPDMEKYGFVSVPYAEFLEYGTGTHSKNGGGRQTPWKYQYQGTDPDTGETKWLWTVTDGMDPHPFIQDSIDENLPRLDASIERDIDISKYTGGRA